nr:putative UPF0481 protein At3g02645 isoform X2 [Nicotiana tomentosiformis]
MASNCNTNSNFDESRWVIQIRRTLDEELEEDTEIPVSIFNVPKALLLSDQDSYVPQVVAIGPYHYWRTELHDMERYKLAAAKITQKQLQSLKFQHLVEQLINFEHRIRCSYHKYLNFNEETLAWMMAVDASFLLEFLQIYAIREEEDALLLREKGIILNRLKSDKEVANLWNGMSRSLRLTKVQFLDKVIEDVNGFYNARWNIKTGKMMKHYVFGSWQVLTFLACIMLLMLMTLQAFCSVYKCARIFHIQNSDD